MPEVLRALFASKKSMAAFLGAMAIILIRMGAQVGIPIPPDVAHDLAPILGGLVASYVLGQGAADWGKEAVKLQQLNPPGPP